VLLAKAVVVAEVVALIFQGIERFIFYPPTCAPGPHNIVNVFTGEGKVQYCSLNTQQ
jgi:hypothetical protein